VNARVKNGSRAISIVQSSIAWLRQGIRVAVLVAILVGCLVAQQVTQSSSPPDTGSVSAANSRLQDRTFQSVSLSRSTKYRVLLPADYFQTTSSYPVLYLLHGWHGDYQNWSTLTKLTQYAGSLPVIVVMPDAGDSWYVDSETTAGDKFEQYIIHDLIDDVDQHWRTLRSSHARAIAGLSMGGYGAVKFALKYPETFRVAASLSGAFNAVSPGLGDARPDLQPSLLQAFGDARNKSREKNDVYSLASSANPQATPYLYVDCGNQDSSFLESNRNLTAILSQRRFSYEYHEYPGEHSWQYWDERLPAVLAIVQRFIATAH
jgi:putative tributyrin esterase